MGLEEDLYAWVKTLPAALLVGDATRPRFYYGAAPQGAAKPYVVWWLTAQPGHLHMRGVSRIESPTLGFDVYGLDGVAVRAIAKSLDGSLNGYRGLMGSTNIRGIFRQSIVDLPELRADGGQGIDFRTRGEYLVWHAT